MASSLGGVSPSFSERFLLPYRWITLSGQFIPEIDGLRFIAMLGVPLLFVISGFILGMPFAAAHLHRRRPVPQQKYFCAAPPIMVGPLSAAWAHQHTSR